MEIKEIAQKAIQIIEKQLSELMQIENRRTGTVDEAFDLLDRWYLRTRKVIDENISNTEANNFKKYTNFSVLVRPQTMQQNLEDKINHYKGKLKVIVEELKTHPDTLIDPSKLIVSSENPSNHDPMFKILHPEITRVSKQKFLDKHYADSVETAFKEVNHRVKVYIKDKYQIEDDGASLMRMAFGGENPKIDMGTSKIDLTKKGMREGYAHIFAGSMQAIRNPKAHENIIIDENRAIHFLFLASLEMSKLDEVNVP